MPLGAAALFQSDLSKAEFQFVVDEEQLCLGLCLWLDLALCLGVKGGDGA